METIKVFIPDSASVEDFVGRTKTFPFDLNLGSGKSRCEILARRTLYGSWPYYQPDCTEREASPGGRKVTRLSRRGLAFLFIEA